MTNRERVLALIRNPPGLTDSEIRQRTGISPHQQVNQICRTLAAAGLTRRITGPHGRIINVPIGSDTAGLQPAPLAMYLYGTGPRLWIARCGTSHNDPALVGESSYPVRSDWRAAALLAALEPFPRSWWR